MDTGITFDMIKDFIKKIWVIVVIGTILGGVLGVVYNQISKKNKDYQAISSVFVNRKFDTDPNGNGFYDNDINRVWANFTSFATDEVLFDKIEEKYPEVTMDDVEKNFSYGSNLFKVSYTSKNKSEAIDIVNMIINYVTENSNKYLTDKVDIANIEEATSENVIVKNRSSLTSNLIVGVIYGFLIGLIISVVRLFLRKK